MAFNIVPKVKKLTTGKGGFACDMRSIIAFTGGRILPGAYLAEAIWWKTDFDLSVEGKRGKEHVFWMSRDGRPGGLAAAAKRALAQAEKGSESYGLVVSEKGVAAAAHDAAGLLYAATTAAQLLEKREGRPFLPACTISDWPDLALRAVHIDLKHHMERFDYLVEAVRRLAAFKVNGLVLELEDKFLYKKHPDITAPVGLSADELASLTQVCQEFHVELIPLVQGLGHASYILRHPRYAGLREKKSSLAEFCPQAAGTYKVLFDLYEEVAAATKGTKYFHIGGDEAWLMGQCPQCSKAVKRHGKFPLYEKWLNKCAGKVRALGRVPMVWDDMLIKDAGDNWGKLPKDLFYVRWNYRANAAEADREKIANYSKSGLKVIVAAAIQTDGPYVPMYQEHFANIDGYAKAAVKGNLAGILTTAWEDSGNHTETFWPGYAATGQAGWNSKVDIDYDFVVEFTKVFHGTGDAKLASVYDTLGRSGMRCFQLFTPEEPYRCENMIALPSLRPARAGKRWRDANKERIATATELAARLRECRKVLSAEILAGKADNVYALEVLLSETRVMLARVDLFFAIRDAELAVEDAHAAFVSGDRRGASGLLESAGRGVLRALDEGEEALSSLEAVWLRTRLPQDMSLFDTPSKKYVHDYDNYWHLAGKTKDLSYHLLVEKRIGAAAFGESLVKGARDVTKAGRWPLK